MPDFLDKLGSFAGVAGLLVCLLTGLMRLAGSFYLGELPLVTLFVVGAVMVVAGCFFKLEALSLRSRSAAIL